MAIEGKKTIFVLVIASLFITAIIYTVSRESDDGWSERAGRVILESDIVRHPLAKGEAVCFLVTRNGSVAQVPCPAFEHLVINPAPPGLPELENE